MNVIQPLNRPVQLKSLTSLRFVAALAVALFHVPFTLQAASATPILSQGAFGVSFFFVLSGFILSHSHPLKSSFEANTFYLKRFARIYPLHILTFVIWISLFFSHWGNSLPDKINSGIANVLLVQAFFSGALYNLGYNAVSWSISVEMFFYIIFPFLRRPSYAASWIAFHIALANSLSTSALASLTDAIPSFFYFNPLARGSEFAIGILAYQAFLRLPKLAFATTVEVASIVGVVVAVMLVAYIPSALEYLFLGTVFAVLIVVFAQQRGFVSAVLSMSPLVLLGESSFALYLIHHMWFRFSQARIGTNVVGIPLLMAALSSAIIISIALHIWFERPAQRLILSTVGRKRTLNGRALFSVGV